MLHRTGSHRHELPRVLVCAALALLVAGAFAWSPVTACAAPASIVDTGAVAAKKAQQQATKAELAALRATLSAQISQYVKVSQQLARTQSEVDNLDAQIAQQDAELEQAKSSFQQRAVEMYRNRRVDLLSILVTAGSLQELMSRANFLVMVGQRDARVITDYRKMQSETLFLQDSLGNRLAYLTQLQAQADDQRSQIESDLAIGEARATTLGTDIARLMRGDAMSAGGSPSGAFSMDTVISDAQFRNSTSMSAGDIQKFLDRQPGVLKSYRTRDHNGNIRYASEMIAEAAVAFHINPKVILVKLQKEQSLLARAAPTQFALDWATGCGRADSFTSYQYKGFGNQIWWGAQKLDKNSKPWHPGIKMMVDTNVAVYPTNASTYSLYKYTPHVKGTTSFWLLFWRYFGNPLA